MDRNILIIVLIIILIVMYIFYNKETFVSGSYDITPSITVDMDWKGATLSKYPYYTNNLVNPPANVLSQIQELQKYQPKEDGMTTSTYVADGTNVEKNIDSPDNREGFTMMNPYVSN